MISKKRNPAVTRQRDTGSELLAVAASSTENSLTHRLFQVSFLAPRFRLPAAQAELITSLAFGGAA